MVKRIVFTFLIAVLISPLLQAQELMSFVDTNQINQNEVFNLTIRMPSTTGNEQPDLSLLEEDFIQVGTSTRNSYTNINGNVQSWTEITLALTPRTTGTFTIPSFRIGGEATNPITITVGENLQTANTEETDIFLRTSVSKNDIYVQEQLVYTVRLYHSIAFDQGAQLTIPQVGNSVVQQLGNDENYQEIVDGIRYTVTERKFVIFPQASGDLTIPPVYFSATAGNRGGISVLLNRNRSVRQIELTSDSHPITVKPQPADYPQGTWLPAQELTITEDWSGPLDDIQVGESITRNLVITATGLSSTLLPGIQYDENDGLKFYPDQASTNDSSSTAGITGTREEGTAIVPSEPGEFEIPALRIPWWDIDTDTLEYATLPAQTLSVTASANGQQSTPFQPQISDFSPPAQDISQPRSAITPDSSLNPALLVTTTVFGLGWLFMTMLWLRNKRRLALADYQQVVQPVRRKSKSPHIEIPAAGEAFRQLEMACRNNDSVAIRHTLINWGQAFFGTRDIQNLEHLAHYCDSASLNDYLIALERAIYSKETSNHSIQAESLLKEIKTVQQNVRKHRTSGRDHSLPPLYQ